MLLSLLLLTAPLSPATVPDPPPVSRSTGVQHAFNTLSTPDPPPVVIVVGRWVQGPDGLWRFHPGKVAPPEVRPVAPFTNPAPWLYGAGYSTTPIINATAVAPRSSTSAGVGRVRLTHTLAGGAGTFGSINCGSLG